MKSRESKSLIVVLIDQGETVEKPRRKVDGFIITPDVDNCQPDRDNQSIYLQPRR